MSLLAQFFASDNNPILLFFSLSRRLGLSHPSTALHRSRQDGSLLATRTEAASYPARTTFDLRAHQAFAYLGRPPSPLVFRASPTPKRRARRPKQNAPAPEYGVGHRGGDDRGINCIIPSKGRFRLRRAGRHPLFFAPRFCPISPLLAALQRSCRPAPGFFGLGSQAYAEALSNTPSGGIRRHPSSLLPGYRDPALRLVSRLGE